MAAKDFSKIHGRRLRLAMGVYDRKSRQFKPGAIALVTVTNAREQARLWAAIEAVIRGGTWRDEHSGSEPVVDPAPVEHSVQA